MIRSCSPLPGLVATGYRPRWAFPVILSLFLIAGGRAGARDLPPPAREEIVMGITQFPHTFHPNINSMLAKSYLLGFVMRPITVHGLDWQIRCMMCTELPSFDNGLAQRTTRKDGSTGMKITYRLADWAVWGDGRPVTTKDVLFTWRAGSHPESGVSNFELYKRITDIEVVDDKTFTMHIDRVSFDYAAINDFMLLPAHLEKPAFEKPAEYRNRTLYDTDITNPGLFNGPYVITDVQPGAQIVMERNPHWRKTPGPFGRIVVRVIENTAALEANLRSGAVDYIPGELGLSIDQALAFEKRFGADFNIVYKPGLIYEHIDLNLDTPILADRRVRRALLHGIDRVAISEQLFGGHQPVAHSFVNPSDWIYTEDVRRYRFDPARARALLEEAGWRVGPEGIRHNARGEKLGLELMTGTGSRIRELVQQVLQSQWRDIGVETRIRNLPPRVMFGEITNQRKFTGGVMFAWFTAPENVPRTILHSEMIPSEENGWGGQNFTGFSHPEMDRLIDETETELDPARRKENWVRMQQIYAEELPVLPLYYRANVFIFPKWLGNVQPTGHQYSTSLWVETWRVLSPGGTD